MKSFVGAGLVAAAASALDQVYLDYLNHIARFGRQFSDEREFGQRLMRFMESDNHIRKVNASDASYKAGHNQFSDWTDDERKAMLGSRRQEAPATTAPVT